MNGRRPQLPLQDPRGFTTTPRPKVWRVWLLVGGLFVGWCVLVGVAIYHVSRTG